MKLSLSLCLFLLTVLWSAGSAEGLLARECEHETVTLSCPGGKIKVLSANYGRTENGICGPESSVNDCKAPLSLIIVSALCDDQETCSIQASNSLFGDPCYGAVKYLEIHYICRAIGCKALGDQSVSVDWWLMYKPADFTEFRYFDSESHQDDSLGRPDRDRSPLTTTFSALTSKLDGVNSVSYFGYSNELNRLIDTFPIRGHIPVSNGFVAFDPESGNGFWLVHSDPFFPPSANGQKLDDPETWGWFNSPGDQPLTYLCVTLHSESDWGTISQFLGQLNPFTFLQHIGGETLEGFSDFLKRSNDTHGQIYLTTVFDNYKRCLQSLPGDQTYENCLSSSELSIGGSSTFNLLSRNKAMVGDVCLDIHDTGPRLQKSLLPPVRNFLNIFAVVGTVTDEDLVCVGDLSNTMINRTDDANRGVLYPSAYINARDDVLTGPASKLYGITPEGSTDYMLQKFLSSGNAPELDMYGGISGGIVCFRSGALWKTLISADLYMEANCFDTTQDEVTEKVYNSRVKRAGKRPRKQMSSGYDSDADSDTEPGDEIQKIVVIESPPSPKASTSGFETPLFGLEQALAARHEEAMDVETDATADVKCFAFHCDEYKDNYAWLLWQPLIGSVDIEVSVFGFPWRQEIQNSHELSLMYSFTVSDMKVQPDSVQNDHAIQVITDTEKIPFAEISALLKEENKDNGGDDEDEEMFDTKNSYRAIRIGKLNQYSIRGEIQYRFNMRPADAGLDTDIDNVFQVTSVMTRRQRKEWEKQQREEIYEEITMCVDWCPLAACKYRIYKRDDSGSDVKYNLAGAPPCTIPGIGFSQGRTIHTLRDKAKSMKCTPEEFQERSCLIYEEDSDDASTCKTTWDKDDVALEPYSLIFDFEDFEKEELAFVKYRFCQSNIINLLFYGDYIAPDVIYPSEEEEAANRKRREVRDEGTDPHCNDYFAGGKWPASTIAGKRVQICHDCAKNQYCFATLFNTDLKVAEYCAYTAVTPPVGAKRLARKAVGDDRKLWGRYEAGLCQTSKKEALYDTTNACKDLGPVSHSKGSKEVTPLNGKKVDCADKLECKERQTANGDYDKANEGNPRKWDRGHLNPAYINSFDIDKMRATFLLINAAAQLGVFNRKSWREMECLLAHYVWYLRKPTDGPVYILTGVIPYSTSKKVPGSTLEYPEFFWTVMCDPDKKKYLAFRGTNKEVLAAGEERIEIKTMVEMEQWLYKGADSLFPDKEDDCKTNATPVDLTTIPNTSSCRLKEVRHFVGAAPAKATGKTTKAKKKAAPKKKAKKAAPKKPAAKAAAKPAAKAAKPAAKAAAKTAARGGATTRPTTRATARPTTRATATRGTKKTGSK